MPSVFIYQQVLFDFHGNQEVEQARRVFAPVFKTLSTSLGLGGRKGPRAYRSFDIMHIMRNKRPRSSIRRDSSNTSSEQTATYRPKRLPVCPTGLCPLPKPPCNGRYQTPQCANGSGLRTDRFRRAPPTRRKTREPSRCAKARDDLGPQASVVRQPDARAPSMTTCRPMLMPAKPLKLPLPDDIRAQLQARYLNQPYALRHLGS
jgi:hypothetical protein